MPATGRRRRNADVRLFEHRDFEQSILRAAEHFRARGLRPAIIEKDYYVTDTSRAKSSPLTLPLRICALKPDDSGFS